MAAHIPQLQLNDLVERGREKYQCIVCKGLLRPPVKMAICGHRMCNVCSVQLINNSCYCPGDEEECQESVLADDKVFPDFVSMRMMKRESVYCPNRKYGCQVIMRWGKLSEHLVECTYTSMTESVVNHLRNDRGNEGSKFYSTNIQQGSDVSSTDKTKKNLIGGKFSNAAKLSEGLHNDGLDPYYSTFTEEDASKILFDINEIQNMVETCGIRLLFAGKYNFGKTSIARSLLYNKNYITTEDDRTIVLNFNSWAVSDDVTVPLFDVGGHESYQQLAHLFHANEKNNVAIIPHDLTSNDYSSTCQWVTDIVTRSPECSIILVLSKCDMLEEGSRTKVVKEFKSHIYRYLFKQIEALKLNLEVASFQSKKSITKLLQKYTEMLKLLRNDENIHVTSCKTGEGVENLRNTIINMIDSGKYTIKVPHTTQLLYRKLGKIGVKSSASLTQENLQYQSLVCSVTLPGILESMCAEPPGILESTCAEPPGILESMCAGPPGILESPSIHESNDAKDVTSINEAEEQEEFVFNNHFSDTPDVSLEQELDEIIESLEASVVEENKKKLQYVMFEEALDAYKSIIHSEFPDLGLTNLELEIQLKHCLKVLHCHGLLIWYGESEVLEKYIFNDMGSFVSMLKSLFQHDLNTFSYDHLALPIKQYLIKEGLFQTDYEGFLKQLEEEGLLSVQLLKILARKFDFENHTNTLIELLEHLNIAVSLPNTEQLFFPWYVERREPPEDISSLIEEMNKPSTDRLYHHIILKGIIPTALFHSFCVKYFKHLKLDSPTGCRSAWKNSVFARVDDIDIFIKLVSNNNKDRDQIDIYIDYPIYCRDSINESWQFIHNIYEEITVLIMEWWPGMFIDFYLKCLHCILGSWNSTEDNKVQTWPVKRHIFKRCRKGGKASCPTEKLHRFPEVLVYPLPDDISMAESCCAELRRYVDNCLLHGGNGKTKIYNIPEQNSSIRSQSYQSELEMSLSGYQYTPSDNKYSNDELTYVVDKLSPCVCRLYIPGGGGTGFIIGCLKAPRTNLPHRYVLTCDHINTKQAIMRNQLTAEFNVNRNTLAVSVPVLAVICSDRSMDYALLRLDHSSALESCLQNVEHMGSMITATVQIEPKKSLAIIGHDPYKSTDMGAYSLSSTDPSLASVRLNRQLNNWPLEVLGDHRFTFYNCHSKDGFSGSPVLSVQKQELYAIHCGVISNNTDVGEYGIMLPYVLQDIKEKVEKHQLGQNNIYLNSTNLPLLFPLLKPNAMDMS